MTSGHPISSSHVMAGIAKGASMPGFQQVKERGERRNWSARVSSASMSQTPSVHTIVSDTDGVEPIDYEEYVSTHSERDQVSRVLQFPEDDIDVNLVQRKIRTGRNRKYQQYSTSLRVHQGYGGQGGGGTGQASVRVRLLQPGRDAAGAGE